LFDVRSHERRAESPNDLKLSDCPARRDGCVGEGGGAAGVTRGAVRSSAWLGRGCRNLVIEYLKLCLSALGFDTPRALRGDDATPASMLVSPLANNLASHNTGLRITAVSVQIGISKNRELVGKYPLTT
jgi:hypothetical protein